MLTPADQDRLHVVLVNSRNPLNIGAAARAMSNFGFPHLRVVHPYPIAFHEAKSAVNTEPVLAAAQQFEQLTEAIADCTLVIGTTGAQRNLLETIATLEAAAPIVQAHLRSGSKVAILFGSEKVGLSNHELSHCQLLLRIPTRTEHPSMNLGQAVAIVLYEFIRQTGPAEPEALAPHQTLATAGEKERLIALLLEALSFNPHRTTKPTLEAKVRRLVRHLALTPSDLHHWLGLLRQLLWKLRATKTPPRD
ncbi:MAG: RNA methyltransferase [Acidobacteriaceae bacterium]